MDALTFLQQAQKAKRQPVYVLSGDEDFLKSQCRAAILNLLLGDTDPEFAVGVYAGDKLDFSTVRNELETVPFLTPVRIVWIESADGFVSEHRETLERYVQKPSSVGVLILEVKTFPETTRLAKALPDGAKLVCKSPATNKLQDWVRRWCKDRHGKTLSPDAAAVLLDLVGPQMGLLDQEMQKLAVAVGSEATITPALVTQYISLSQSANVFHILDAIGNNKPDEALKLLSELFAEGKDPLAIMGALTGQLRKLATVGRLVARGQTLGMAMDAAGVPKWPDARMKCEKQIRHLGLRRLEKLPDWLIDINLGLKGGNPLPGRLQVERLIVQLARPRETPASA